MFSLEVIETRLKEMGFAYTKYGHSHASFFSFKSLRKVEPFGLYFITEELSDIAQIQNSIVLTSEVEYLDTFTDSILIKVQDPQFVYYSLMQELVNENHDRMFGIHPTAIVSSNCEVDPTAYVGPYCLLENCTIGAGSKLYSHVVVFPKTEIGDYVEIQSHTTIGATGIAWTSTESGVKIRQPQIGFTKIGSGTFLGSNVTIARGSINEATSIGSGCLIAHGTMIGHGCSVGDECHISNSVTLGGNVDIARKSFLGSGVVVRSRTKIAERTVVGAGSLVLKNILEEGTVVAGVPATKLGLARKSMKGVPKIH